jgi:azurin
MRFSLVAALPGLVDHLVGGHVGVVGDVEEVAVLAEQDVLAALDRDVLAQRDDAVIALALPGPVGELDDILRGLA